MHIIDINTSFGKRVDPDPRYALETLVQTLDSHAIALALSYATRACTYDMHAGNEDTLAAVRRYPQILPAAVLNPHEFETLDAEWQVCRSHGVRAVRLFPVAQHWSVSSAAFQWMLKRLEGSGVSLMFSLAETDFFANGAPDHDYATKIAQATAGLGLSVILTDTHYVSMAEVIAVMRQHPHVYCETNWLASTDAIEMFVEQVGAARLIYGSSAPVQPMQKTLNVILEAAISAQDKAAILGGNAIRILGIKPAMLEGRPQLTDLAPKRFEEPVIDVHTHLGACTFCCTVRHEDYDPRRMLERMQRYGVAHSVVSSIESMRHDMARGNQALAAAIATHPQLHGYVELDPYHLQLSCGEMDMYYAQPNFIGAELELTHIPARTDSREVQALIAAVAQRGKPILLKPGMGDAPEAERELARRHPQLAIIHAHGFDADWARVVADTPNIYVEHNLSKPRHHDIRDSLDILGSGRVLFGSDQTLLSLGASIGAYWDAAMNAAERGQVLQGNAQKIFKLH